MTAPSNTSEKIMAAIRQLNEADRVRVLRFALAISESRRGKKERRRSRFSQPQVDETWRVGS